MKRIFSLILLISLLGTMLFAADNREFRATWSITWHQFSGSMSAEQMKARTREIMDKHVEAGMNAVLWHVRQGGTVYYPSTIEPWGSYIGYSDPGYDPLAYAVEEAHKRGLELHAWFNTFATSSTIAGAPAAEHPDWVCRDGNGDPMGASRCLSPGLKDVRDYTVALVAEIVQNYDIDGIHFDYVRWNEYDNSEASFGFAEYAEEHQLPDGMLPPGMEEYLKERTEAMQTRSPQVPSPDDRYLYDVDHPESAGIPDSTDLFPDATPGVKFASWGDWRRGATNVFIKAVHDTVQAIRPWVKVSPAALGRYRAASWNGYYSVFQDAARWFNEGWIDLLTPMSYHWLTGTSMYSQLLSDWNPYISAGKAAGRPYSVGPASYLISSWSAHKDIVETCRTISWVKGFQFFSYGNWRDSRYPLESSHTIFAQKSKQPSYQFMNAAVPATPSATLTKNNDTSYTLEVVPDAGTANPQWFVIYRSKDEVIDVDSNEIVDIVFSDSAFTRDMNFDGLQLSDRYYYGVTMASRYWVESPLSTVLSTDVLPMTPAQVTDHIPADGAVNVPNNQIVELHFNKNMDAVSVSENLSISPEPANLSLNWSNPTWVKDDHLILYLSASWAFETNYTVTLAGSALDQAGQQLDGNGDGSTGDNFSFGFSISGADDTPPLILASYPAEGEISIDVDMPVNLLFNELLDPATLQDKFTYYYGDYVVHPGYSVYNLPDNKTHVTVKPNSMMASGSAITLEMAAGICDTAGNAMDAQNLNFGTDSTYYTSRRRIDDFSGDYTWERPGYSGSTSGINDSQSSSAIVSENYVPGFSDNKALRIIVVPETEGWFARIYSASLNAVKNIDTSKSIQAYIYGDGTPYQFRFALAESSSSSGNSFEVSRWFDIDWQGWQLVEWDLKNPLEYGEWGGMTGGSLDGTAYSMNSLQLRGTAEAPLSTVQCYIDQMRSAEKSAGSAPENFPPVIEELPDTSTMSGVAVYIQAEYSDPNPGDQLSFELVPDTATFNLRYYSTAPGRVRILPENDYVGVSNMMAIVKDNGVGELSDTAFFKLTVTFNSDVADIPEHFTVHSNYPNPFNPQTTLHFELPQREDVRVEVFNTRGQQLGTILDRSLEAGSYRVQFDGSMLPSGVYFYRIIAGEKIHVDRMTLLK